MARYLTGAGTAVTTATGLLLVGGVAYTIMAINTRNAYDDLPTAALRRKGQRQGVEGHEAVLFHSDLG